MDYYSNQMSKLIEELSCLPGIGAKSAARLAFHLIHMPVDDVKRLASTMVEARENIKYCKECYTLTDQELCPICSNSNRDHQTIMVVENTRDLAAYEKTGKYNGVYHVLHGAIKPTGIKVSRIASGVPVGGDLEYIDEVTLLRALEGRTEL